MNFDYKTRYDVVVSGAGVAGVAAALAAARRGHKTALIEKQTLIGGLATSGLIFIYLPLCDGCGKQVTFGISEELLWRSIDFSPFDPPEQWGGAKGGKSYNRTRFETFFSPAGFTLSMDEMLKEAGVDLWLDTMVCAVQKASDGKVTAVEVENCSGRGLVSASSFVDATGDATVIRRAGGAFEHGENFQSLWVMEHTPETVAYPFAESIRVVSSGDKWCPENRLPDASNSKNATAFTRKNWEYLRNKYRAAYASGKTDRYQTFPVHLPAMPQFRKIARIKGIETLGDGDEWTHFDNSIGLYADWLNHDIVYETPFGVLIPEDVRGVFAAGRCISTTGSAWETYRVIPSAAMTGEAAGVGAALSVEQNCDGSELKVDDVRNALRKNGFKFHFEELGLIPPAQRK